MPKRIQRKRIKGYRLPDGVVYVGRPTRFGNPFRTAEEFRRWMQFGDHLESDGTITRTLATQRQWILDNADSLRGKDLACWCKLDNECHADVLLELANRTDS